MRIADFTDFLDMVLDEFELNPNTVDTFAAEKNSNSWKCGVTNAHKDSRLSYFMRIIGGRPTTPGKWPWQVAVLNRYHVRNDQHEFYILTK